MLEHRLRDFFSPSEHAAVAVMNAPAFVACPMPGVVAAPQYNFVAEVYRMAQAMTEAQLRKPARTWPPAFSLN
jgi:hypothetical protein